MKLFEIHQEIQRLERQRSKLTIDAMATIQEEVDTINGQVKTLRAKLDAKIDELEKAARATENKPTGVVNIEAEGVKIKHTRPKSVTWDQEVLAGIVERIAASGDDPSEYVQAKYTVLEKSFQAWPKKIKDVFLPARMFKPGKPSYKITVPEPAGLNV